MQILKPYRERIDAVDRQLIDLFIERFGIIAEVGHLKAREGIEAVLQDRVDEVRNNAVNMAKGHIDSDFIYALWTDIIKYSCDLEEDIKAEYKNGQKVKA